VKGTREEQRGLEEMNQLGLQFIYAWQYQKETPCVAIFISNKQKCHFFSHRKLGNKRVEQVLAEVGEVGTSGVEKVGKVVKRVNTVQKMCTHVWKCKNDTSWHCSRNQGRRDKGEQWRVNSNMIYLIYHKNLFKCHNNSHPAQQ
jgi:hypothetical protein